jgi:hypothetical protein
MNFKLKQKIATIALFFVLLFSPLSVLAVDAYKYSPMEEIPGFGRPDSYELYILAIYKFGLWTVGISAMLMISVGAFMYITSAGNTSATGKAKGIIFDAIAGLILALTSYVLLYTINPELVTISGVNQAIDSAAKTYSSSGGKYPTIDQPLPANCKDSAWKTAFAKAASGDIDACLLEAVTAIESGCKLKPSRTNGGQDCGAMQTRAASAPCSTTCDELEKSPGAAIACGAKYLASNYKNNRTPNSVNSVDQKIHDYYAGFNGGPGALAVSSSCTGMTNDYGNNYEKWDCPKDCGGYCVVPARTATVLNYYKKCIEGK